MLSLTVVSVPLAAAIIYWSTAGGRATSIGRGVEPPIQRRGAAPLTVGVSAIRPVWLSVTVDGTRIIERTLAADEPPQRFDAQYDVVLTAGDAAAIAMTINGAKAAPLGGAGETVTTRIDPTNYRLHLAAP
jgi:hypothetical protein